MTEFVPESVEGSTSRSSRPGSNPGLALAVIFALAVAFIAGVLMIAINLPTVNEQQKALDDRNEAIKVAEQFTLRLDTFSYQDLDGYAKRVSELLTEKMRADFNGSFKGFDAAFQAIQITSKGTVLAAGVQDIDADSATVLVIHDVNVTSKGCVQPPYKRMSVDLRKVKGKWLVDDFKEGVPGCQG